MSEEPLKPAKQKDLHARQAKAARRIAKQGLYLFQKSIDERLDGIEDYVKGQLQKIDKRNTSVQGWLVNEVKVNLQNELFNATCTVDAVVEVLADSDIKIKDFDKKVDLKKAEISERKQKEAEKKFKAETAQRIQEGKDLDAKKKETGQQKESGAPEETAGGDSAQT